MRNPNLDYVALSVRIWWIVRIHKQWIPQTMTSSISLSISRSIINESNRIRAAALRRIALPDRTDRRCSLRDRCLTMKPKIIKIATARCHEKFKIPRPFQCPLTFYLTRDRTKPRNSSHRYNIFLQEDLRSFALFSGAPLSRLFMLQREMTREKRRLVLAINNNGSRRSMCLASDTAAFCLLQQSLLREIASIVSRM